ncbi:MAG TPA: hypothetical protein VFR86_31630 [Burkholderiaceae bacterium]|nr:hypothetical protein [Burkholderiaceae bacterium]
MPERTTDRTTLRAGTPMMLGGCFLLPIERVVLHVSQGGTGLWLWAAKELHALIVRDENGTRAIGTDAAAVSLDTLRKQIPQLDSVLG